MAAFEQRRPLRDLLLEDARVTQHLSPADSMICCAPKRTPGWRGSSWTACSPKFKVEGAR